MAMHQELYAPREAPSAKTAFIGRVLRNMAAHDWVVLGMAVILFFQVLRAPEAEMKSTSLQYMGAMVVMTIVTMLLVRGDLLKRSFFSVMLYRLTLLGVPLMTYFSLATVLPVVNTTALDQELYQLDLFLFGFEPAMAMDPLVNSFTTEWFSFFYFGYFFLLSVYVLPVVFVWRRIERSAEFGFAILFAFCVSHVVYTLVPGYGPWRAFPDEFQNQFPSGMWWDLTIDTVVAAGAMKDIFPSLHTAAPTVLALFSYRYRHEFPFKYTWIPVAFFTVNIIGATMFLRWHYVIDVVVGLGLAITASALAHRVVRREAAKRRREGLQEAWPDAFPTPRGEEKVDRREVATA